MLFLGGDVKKKEEPKKQKETKKDAKNEAKKPEKSAPKKKKRGARFLIILLCVLITFLLVALCAGLLAILAFKKETKTFDPSIFKGRDLQELTQTLQKEYLQNLYSEYEGDLEKMAQNLGIQLAGLYKWFKKAGIDIKSMRRQTRD